MKFKILILFLATFLIATSLSAQQTQIKFLSGTDAAILLIGISFAPTGETAVNGQNTGSFELGITGFWNI